MKHICIVLAVIMVFASCKEFSDNHTEKNNSVSNKDDDAYKFHQPNDTIKIKESKSDSVGATKFADIELSGIEKDFFTRQELGDTLFLIKKSYEGIDRLKISSNNLKEPITGVISYGALQYTVDDSPAFPLETSFIDSVVINKDAHGNYNVSDALKTRQEIASLIRARYYDSFLNESIKTQKVFYNKIINDNSYVDCCPEYIEKAKLFLERNKASFKSTEDLALEPTYNKVVLDLGENRWLVFANY